MNERIREEGPTEVLSATHMEFYYWTPRTQRSAPTNDSYRTRWTHRYMRDVNTPGFKEKQAKGLVVCSPMMSYSVIEEYPLVQWSNAIIPADPSRKGILDVGVTGTYRWLWKYTTGEVWKPWLVYVDPFYLSKSARSAALSEAYANVGDAEANLWESAAEMRESFNTIVGLMGKAVWLSKKTAELIPLSAKARKIRIAMKALRSGAKKTAFAVELARLTKQAAAAWLEYRYGIRPIVNDIRSVAAAIHKRAETRRTSRGFRDASWTTHYKGLHAGTHSTVDFEWDMTMSSSWEFRAGILYELDNVLCDQLNAYGMSKIYTLPWELFPYSFVIDWFIGVGRWLESWAPVLGVTKKASWITSLRVTTQNCTLSAIPQAGYSPGYVHDRVVTGSAVISRTERCQDRQVGVLPPLLPTVDVSLNIAKLADIVALLMQLRHHR